MPLILGIVAFLLEGVFFFLLQEPEIVAGNRIWEYLVMVAKLWGNHIAGPILAVISIPLGVAAAYYSGDPTTAARVVKWSAWLTGSASIFMIFVAQYDAWCGEREKYETELAKNGKPEIRGEASGFRRHGLLSEGRYEGGPSHASVQIKFTLTLCNHRPVPTNLKAIELNIQHMLGKVTLFSDITLNPLSPDPMKPNPSPNSVLLDYAISATVQVFAMVTVYGLMLVDLKEQEVALDKLEVYAVDGLGGRHRLAIPAEEKLWFIW
jgi:hypothetical protein